MSDLYVLEHFNSNYLELPDYFHHWFDQCYMFAKQILKDWSDEEIARELEKMDRYIASRFQYDLALHFIQTTPNYDPSDNVMYTATGRAGYAVLNSDMYAGTPIENVATKATAWHELFAVYTIGLIAYADRDTRFMEKHERLNTPNYIQLICADYLGEAVEAITVAKTLMVSEHHPLMKQAFAMVSEKKQEIAHKGGTAKGKKYKPLMTKVIQLYKTEYQDKNFSNRLAAKHIWSAIPGDDKRDDAGYNILTEENAEERVAKWIANYRKNPDKYDI